MSFTPLSDPLPLRTSAVWGDAGRAILPWVFGRTTVAGVRYQPRVYLLADHALAGVDAVSVAGKPVAGWQWRNGSDNTGHAAAWLELAEDPGTNPVAAQVRGLSGDPADILAALGVSVDLQELRTLLRQTGIVLGGALTSALTRRAAMQFVVEQFGGGWSAGMPGFATLFPPPDTDPTWASFGPLDRSGLTAECALSDVVTRLTIPYAWNYASNVAGQTLTLSATSAATYGVRTGERALPWVQTARDAAIIGQRWLEWNARPLWTLKFQAGPEAREIPPGGWIELTGSDSPVHGRAVVLDIDPGLGSGVVQITAQAPAGTVPAVGVG